MPVVNNIVTDPAGTPIQGVQVVVTCVGVIGEPVYNGTSVIEGPRTTITDASGTWTMTLPGNASLTPANTYYQVVETLPSTHFAYTSTISVPASGGPYSLSSILVTPPASLSPPGITGVQVALAGTVAGSRPEINLIQGSGASLTVADNPASNRVDVTVGATGGVPSTRAINTTAPLTGGGTLASDLTLGVSAATTLATGVIQLAGDLGGTATSPTVPGRVRYRGAWAASTAYAVNDLLTYVGDSFLVTTAFTSGTSFSLTNLAVLTAPPHVFKPQWYGAVGNGTVLTDGAMTATSTTLTSASASFSAADVGKAIIVKGAAATGVTSLVTTIASVTNATTAVLTVAATTTVSSAYVLYGTDDTAAIQAAINAADSYATSHGYGQCYIPPAPNGHFYALASALVKGGATAGNAHLTLPVHAVAGNKVTLEICGSGDGTALFHWNQTTPQVSGSALVSFGVYASTTAQTTDINANGNPAIIGGPNQAYGYGIGTTLFSNMLIVLRGLALVNTFAAYGINYGAYDLSGCAEANVFDCGYGVATTFTDLQSYNLLANGLSIGSLMPANGNNDNSACRNISVWGGYTYAAFLTEHTVCDAIRVTYCWAALCIVGTYFGSVGSTHAVWIGQASIEAVTRHINIIGSGSGGVGPYIHVQQLDSESSVLTIYDGSNGGSGGFALGDVSLSGLLSTVSVPNPTGIRVRSLNQQPGYAATPSYTLGTAFINPYWRDALVTLSGGTVTGVSVGTPHLGVGCLGGSGEVQRQPEHVVSDAVTVAMPERDVVAAVLDRPAATAWLLELVDDRDPISPSGQQRR